MKNINSEYELVEKLFDKVYISIFIQNKEIEILEHEMLELSLAIENLGISLNNIKNKI